MRPILSTFLFFTYLFSQENNTQQDSVLQSAEMEPDTTTEMPTPMSNVDSDESVNQVLTSVPLGLDSGYKGFAWGSLSGSTISTIFTPIANIDTASTDQSFTGMLGLDSVKVKYSFADSGFWKAEIDFLIDENEVTLKRLHRKGKTIALEAANKVYETKIFGPDRVRIQGQLKAIFRQYS